MKIIENHIEIKEVSYFDITLLMPANTTCVATDSNGYTYAYTCRVSEMITNEFGFWTPPDKYSAEPICKVDLQGKDWRVAIQGYDL